jgi:hypothetical protein
LLLYLGQTNQRYFKSTVAWHAKIYSLHGSNIQRCIFESDDP